MILNHLFICQTTVFILDDKFTFKLINKYIFLAHNYAHNEHTHTHTNLECHFFFGFGILVLRGVVVAECKTKHRLYSKILLANQFIVAWRFPYHNVTLFPTRLRQRLSTA